MNYLDIRSLEYLYHQIYENVGGDISLIPRRDKNIRQQQHKAAIKKQLQEYVKSGSVGNIILQNAPVEVLPDNLTKVGGTLNLIGTLITVVPDTLKFVDGSLALTDTPITSLPTGLTVTGDLYLRHTKNLKTLPTNLTVYNDLFLNGSNITSIPNDLVVGWDLYLLNTPLARTKTVDQLRQMLPGVEGKIITKYDELE